MPSQAVYQLVTQAGGAGTPGASPTAGYRRHVGYFVTSFDQRAHMQRMPMAQVGAPAVAMPALMSREYRYWLAAEARAARTLDVSYQQRLRLAQVGAPAAAFPALQRPRASDYPTSLSATYWQRLPTGPYPVIPPQPVTGPVLPRFNFWDRKLDPSFYQRLPFTAAQPWYFDLSVSPNYWRFDTPGVFNASVSLRSLAGAPGLVALTVLGLPTGVTALVTPAVIPSNGGAATVSLTVDGSAAYGLDRLTLVAIGEWMTLETSLTLEYVPPPGPNTANPVWGATQMRPGQNEPYHSPGQRINGR